MNFLIQIDNTLCEDTIVLRACNRNKEYLHEVLQLIQKNGLQIQVYDDMHNLYLITCHQIYYIESVDHKVYIYTKNQVYRSYQKFSNLKDDLKNYNFRQINQYTLVNLYHIKSIHIEKECHRKITLDNNEHLIVNRSYRSFLED